VELNGAAMLKALSMIEALQKENSQLRQIITKQAFEIADLTEELAQRS
jgi:hypothetical protein